MNTRTASFLPRLVQFLLLLLAGALLARAADSPTVIYSTLRLNGAAFSNVVVQVTPIQLSTLSNSIVAPFSYSNVTRADGTLTITNIVPQNYRVTMRYQTGIATFTNCFTGLTGTIYASDYICGATPTNGLIAYSTAQADALFALRTNAIRMQTNGVSVAAGYTNLNWSSGVTGYLSGATLVLGVSSAGSSVDTNAFQPASATLTNLSGTGALTNAAQFVASGSGSASNLTVRSLNGVDSLALTVNTNSLVVTNGRVGIGKNAPGAALEVAGLTNLMQLSVPSNSGVPPLMIDFNESQDGGRKMIYFHAYTGSSPQQMRLAMRDKVGYGVDLIANGAGVGSEFRVDNHGATALLSVSAGFAGVPGILKMGGSARTSASAFQGHVNIHAPSAGTLVVSNGSAGYATVTLSNVMATGFLEMVQIAATNTPATDSVRLWAANNGGTAELIASDEAGNVVQLTSHPADAPPAFYVVTNWTRALPRISKTVNLYLGIVEWNNDTLAMLLRKWELKGTNIAALPQPLRRALADALHEEETFAEYTARTGEALVQADWGALQAERQASWNAARAKELEEFNTPLTVTNDAGAVVVLPNNTNIVVRADKDIRKVQPGWLKSRVKKEKKP